MMRKNKESIHISPERGTVKSDVQEAMVEEGWGLEGDAHGGDWDRQVSIFPVEALTRVPEEKQKEVFEDGYTENVTITGVSLEELLAGRSPWQSGGKDVLDVL